MQLVGDILPTVHIRTVCVVNKAEQKIAKQNNRTWLEGLLTIKEYQNFLEEGKLVVGVACVACMMSRCYFWEYCRRLLVLQYILPTVELV